MCIDPVVVHIVREGALDHVTTNVLIVGVVLETLQHFGAAHVDVTVQQVVAHLHVALGQQSRWELELARLGCVLVREQLASGGVDGHHGVVLDRSRGVRGGGLLQHHRHNGILGLQAALTVCLEHGIDAQIGNNIAKD
eukprot:Mycagemm_TRINITY_DN9412_c0_g1::TRINITY_DN9412_c0_g1_i1::g.3039::m.3039 type:complete len:138 gc:universal TRINITY_DN9412_c0_g1_i1:442-29(-)